MSRDRAKAPSQRQLRVGEELRHALAQLLSRGELRDPELAGVPITVTEVRASPDLKNATAYVMPLGGGEEAPVVEALQRAAPFLRGRLAREVTLKFTPALTFEVDHSFAAAERIRAILRQTEADKDNSDDGA
ncbi:MAG TPA: 30S ribosome-binding factor RbfA [Alphaproteobacteria bacterium]|nr:30S ribosome-binding factor RbfA [Alphaproteobacteria bacterium]